MSSREDDEPTRGPSDVSDAPAADALGDVLATAHEDLHHRMGGDPNVTATAGPGPGPGAGTGTGAAPRNITRDSDVVPGSAAGRARAGGGSPLGAILAALIVGLLVGGGAIALFNQASDDSDGGAEAFAAAIDEDRYQAVILSNDKVYFGQIRSISDEFFQLDNAFFLRETRESEEAEPVRALLPVNREIHAPENTMLIRKDEVVLIENLAEDSPILTEITRQKG